jgi:hypothetical protein
MLESFKSKDRIWDNVRMSTCVLTLVFGSQPKQGLAKVQAESETQKSHAPGSVRECGGKNPHTPK